MKMGGLEEGRKVKDGLCIIFRLSEDMNRSRGHAEAILVR